MWEEDGTYTVRVTYGSDNMIETTFEFYTKQSIGPTTNIFEVDAGNRGTFDVSYTIRGGTVKDMLVDPDNFGLTVIIDSDIDGSITLDLPRASIDAKKSDGSDDTFLVYIDGAEVPLEETVNSNSRKINIKFQGGDSDIEIIGNILFSGPIAPSSISVSVDESTYAIGDIISVSGKVFPATRIFVTLTIENPVGRNILTENLSSKSDGSFSTLIIAGGDGWEKSGKYSLNAQVGNTKSKTTFNFVLDESPPVEPKLPRPEEPTPLNQIQIISVESRLDGQTIEN